MLLSSFLTLVLCSVTSITFSSSSMTLASDVSVVHPVKVFRAGQFLSHSLAHRFKHGRHKRDVGPLEERVYYKVNYKGRDLVFNLTVNNYLVSNDYILERRNGSVNRTEHRTTGENACHLIGTVTDSTNARGTAAISTCEGLKGLFTLPEGLHFIEPVQGSTDGAVEGEGPEPHVVYPSITTAMQRHKRSSEALDTLSPCGVKETMVVADSELIEYHGSDNVESYVFTIMNMVAGIFHDASIGNAIHIILVRLILLQGEEKGLKIVHHADTSLASFCAWQKNLNPQSDTHPAHHDVAVLVTRKDICAGLNQPCETLGLSHLSGMCQPHRSCNINEDSGLPVAFTIAHELGHSFGIHHDGQGNDCEMVGRHPFIMSRQLMYDTSPLTWSSCSKDYITRFLDRGWGFCLDDRPSKKDLTTPLARLGIRYTTQHQCQLQYGPNATYCHEIDNVCQILWCSVNGSCRSKLDSPIDGTRCGPEKWCISGECVIVGKLPETVNGNWGQWSSWSHCSRTCGAGVQSADRECDHPKPEFGGRYCTGERRRYRICNTKPCQKAKPTFREMLCSEFDTVPYQNELYEWVPVASPSSPCELHCRPVSEHFSEKMLDAVTDGTPCFMNNNSRSICVNGVCKEVGCDYGIDSNAVEDQCGVCLGDGSSCETVQMTFDGGDGFGYVDVGVIPEGARDIVVQEVEEAGNFLALRGQMSEEYFLNGQYIIQWNGEYKAGGATFYYERSGNLENLTSSGPTKQPVMIQLLYQEKNPGIKYEYTIKRSRQTGNEVIKSEYRWRHGAWTDCSTTCGLGEQQQPVRCFELEVGVVDESLCDPESRPEDRHRKCKNMECPARWWVGGWQLCSATCGSEGVRKRTVMCVRTVAGEERVLHPGDCKQLLKPKPVVPCNRDLPCGPDWAVGSWSAVQFYSQTFSPSLPPCLFLCFCTCLDPFSSLASLSCLTPNQSPATVTTTRLHPTTTPHTSVLTTSLTTPHTSRVLRTTSPSTPQTSAGRRAVTTRHYPLTRPKTTPFINPSIQRTTRVPHTTPPLAQTAGVRSTPKAHYHSKQALYPTTEGTFYTRDAPYSTSPSSEAPHPSSRIIKLKKPSEIPKNGSFAPRSKKPGPLAKKPASRFKGPSPHSKGKGQNQKPESPVVTFTSDYGSLNAQEPISMDVFWVVGNWSECSMSCGLGAVWRPVLCSSQQESDCANLERPEPARTCHLRPCATWLSGNWSKVRPPRNCAGSAREVQCVDGQKGRPLRPFHCQALSSRPPSTLSCHPQPCQPWRTSPWGQCSRSCGGGLWERLVYCPEPQRCSATQRPNDTETCNLQPCIMSVVFCVCQCSVSCGGGMQHRVVPCVVEDSSLSRSRTHCLLCRKNSMSSRFCDKLKLLGRCSLRSIQKQCCVTSGPNSNNILSNGYRNVLLAITVICGY
uniref:ADAM metallopeptidase with thrombospondin type 1 motif, 12 n=1 Tax=Salmo trutta TaxID=8032 RepID=A0A674AJ57_SALTR